MCQSVVVDCSTNVNLSKSLIMLINIVFLKKSFLHIILTQILIKMTVKRMFCILLLFVLVVLMAVAALKNACNLGSFGHQKKKKKKG